MKTAGHNDRAIAAYTKCTEIDPDFGEAYWSLANLKTFRFSDAQIQTMRDALTRSDLDDEHRLHLDFALGKALEDRRDYAASFHHYAAGNALRLKRVPYSADETSRRVATRAQALHGGFLPRTRKAPAAPTPSPIFIVGLPRSGSTLIEQILASHSQVEGTMELPEITSMTRALKYAGERQARITMRSRA